MPLSSPYLIKFREGTLSLRSAFAVDSVAPLRIQLTTELEPQQTGNSQAAAITFSFDTHGSVSLHGWLHGTVFSFFNLTWSTSSSPNGFLHNISIELLPISSGQYLRLRVDDTTLFALTAASLASQGVALPPDAPLLDLFHTFVYTSPTAQGGVDTTWTLYNLSFNCANQTAQVSPASLVSGGDCFLEDISSASQRCENGSVVLTTPVDVSSEDSVDLSTCGGCTGLTVANSLSISGGSLTIASDYPMKVCNSQLHPCIHLSCNRSLGV